jgi:hypothetical protein
MRASKSTAEEKAMSELPRCVVCGEMIKLSTILAGEALRRFRGEAVEWKHAHCEEVVHGPRHQPHAAEEMKR